jgi:hypothetical protein
MKKARLVLFAAMMLGVVLLSTACAPVQPTVTAIRTADSPPHAAVAPSHVVIVAGQDPKGSFDVLGVVTITAHGGDDPLALLRFAAARLGADVVTEVRMRPTTRSVNLSGVALASRSSAPP